MAYIVMATRIYSDDGGDHWTLASKDGFGGGAARGSMGANEDQLVQLRNGSLPRQLAP